MEDLNEKFNRLVETLKTNGKVPYQAIEKTLGISRTTRHNFRHKVSPVSESLINKLFEEYPQLYVLEGIEGQPPPVKEEMLKVKDSLQEIREEIEGLRARIIELERVSSQEGKEMDLVVALERLVKLYDDNKDNAVLLPVIQRTIDRFKKEL